MISLLFIFIFIDLFSYAQSFRNVKGKKPNIIFILTDDQRWDALGVMGNPIIKTPNMDKLASAGILFENSYVTTSICCVSRASILTGQYESRHKINDFVTDLTPAALAETYPVLLAGIPVPAKMQGENLIAVLENKIPARKDFFYQHYFLGSPKIPKEEGVVTKDFKYMNYIEHNYEELYDIVHDPHETTNLINDNRYKKKLEELRKRYKELKRKIL